jgi:hypothetical protein
MKPEDLKTLFADGVSVVGNAKSILRKTPLAHEIDSRPTIRFNWIDLNHTKYTGSRKDCICTNIPQKIKEVEYKILIGKVKDSRFDFFRYTDDLLSNLRKNLSKKPSNGIRILYLLDYLEIKDVHIYGFDWKETPSLIKKTRKSTAENEHHNYQQEKAFCLELVQQNNWKHY